MQEQKYRIQSKVDGLKEKSKELISKWKDHSETFLRDFLSIYHDMPLVRVFSFLMINEQRTIYSHGYSKPEEIGISEWMFFTRRLIFAVNFYYKRSSMIKGFLLYF